MDIYFFKQKTTGEELILATDKSAEVALKHQGRDPVQWEIQNIETSPSVNLTLMYNPPLPTREPENLFL